MDAFDFETNLKRFGLGFKNLPLDISWKEFHEKKMWELDTMFTIQIKYCKDFSFFYTGEGGKVESQVLENKEYLILYSLGEKIILSSFYSDPRGFRAEIKLADMPDDVMIRINRYTD